MGERICVIELVIQRILCKYHDNYGVYDGVLRGIDLLPKTNMHLPHNPSSSLHGLKCISLWQFMIAKYISPLDKKCISLKTFQIHAYALK